MLFSEFPDFNLDDLTEFNNNFCGDNFGFDGFNWDSSNVAGQSQLYTGVDVRGDLNNYPGFPNPTAAPTSLYPTQGVFPDEGKSYCASWWPPSRDSLFDHRIQLPILPGRFDALLLLATTGDRPLPAVHSPPLPCRFASPNPFSRL